MIIVFSFDSKKYIFEDIGIEIITCVISYYIKDNYERQSRDLFIEKFERKKFEKYFEYNKKLVNSMSGLHFTFSKNNLIFSNDNVRNLLKKMLNNKNLKSNLNFFYK